MLKAIEEQMKREKFEVMNFDDYCALGNTVSRLRSELAALKAELREICAAIDDPACDLTLTAVECIKKLKAENEWQPIETAPKDGAEFLTYCPSYANKWWISTGKCNLNGATHWMPLPKPPAMAQSGKRGPEMDSEAEAIDAAMAQGEKK